MADPQQQAPWEKYQGTAQAGPWQKYGSTQPTAPAAKPQEPTVMSNLGLTEGPDVRITDYPHATLSGVQSIGRGLRGAVQGAGRLIAHPIDTVKSLGEIPSQVGQVPSAIHDINESPDPAGTYAKVGQETAGQGAGQALMALGTEGLARGAVGAGRAIPKSVTAAPVRLAARATEGVINSSPMRYVRSAGKLFTPADEARKMIRIPGRDLGLAEPIKQGAPFPEAPPKLLTQAKGLYGGAKAASEPSEALAKIPPIPSEALATAPKAAGKIGGRLVLSPEEAQQAAQIQKIAKVRASQRGMQYAGGMRPSGGKIGAP